MARGNARRCRAALDQGLQLAAGSGTSVGGRTARQVGAADRVRGDFDSAVALDAARTAMSAASRYSERSSPTPSSRWGRPCTSPDQRTASAASPLSVVPRRPEARSISPSRLGCGNPALRRPSATHARRSRWLNRWRRPHAYNGSISGQPCPLGRRAVPMARLRRSTARRRRPFEPPSVASTGLERPQILADLALALSDTGETDEAYRMLDRSAREADTGLTRGVAAYYLAEVEWAAGRPSRALSAAEAALGQNLPEPIQIVLRSLRLWALFDLGRPASDPKLRRTIYPLTAGVLDEGRAFALLAEGRLKEAEDAMIAAAGSWHENVVRCELRSRWAAGELARRRGDAERARALLCEVEQEAMAVDCVPVLGRVRASLRCLVKSSGPRSTARPQLSRRETEFLQLVATGQTSIVIATARNLGADRRRPHRRGDGEARGEDTSAGGRAREGRCGVVGLVSRPRTGAARAFEGACGRRRHRLARRWSVRDLAADGDAPARERPAGSRGRDEHRGGGTGRARRRLERR